jgi:ATP-dependent Zn protease
VNSRSQYLVYFLLVVAIGAMLVMAFRDNAAAKEPLTINEVAQKVQSGQVDRIVTESDDTITVYMNGDKVGVASRKEPNATLVEQLLSLGVTADKLTPESLVIEVPEPSLWSGFGTLIVYLLPILLMVGVLWFIMRQAPPCRLARAARACSVGNTPR